MISEASSAAQYWTTIVFLVAAWPLLSAIWLTVFLTPSRWWGK